MPRRFDRPLNNSEKARLHIWPAGLGLDDDLRRDIQREQTGHESCKDMTLADFLKLKQHYQYLGVNQAGGKAGASQGLRALYGALERRGDRPDRASLGQLKKIVRMLNLPRGGEEKFFNRALKRNVGVAHWRWLETKEASDMIEALKARKARGKGRRRA